MVPGYDPKVSFYFFFSFLRLWVRALPLLVRCQPRPEMCAGLHGSGQLLLPKMSWSF